MATAVKVSKSDAPDINAGNQNITLLDRTGNPENAGVWSVNVRDDGTNYVLTAPDKTIDNEPKTFEASFGRTGKVKINGTTYERSLFSKVEASPPEGGEDDDRAVGRSSRPKAAEEPPPPPRETTSDDKDAPQDKEETKRSTEPEPKKMGDEAYLGVLSILGLMPGPAKNIVISATNDFEEERKFVTPVSFDNKTTGVLRIRVSGDPNDPIRKFFESSAGSDVVFTVEAKSGATGETIPKSVIYSVPRVIKSPPTPYIIGPINFSEETFGKRELTSGEASRLGTASPIDFSNKGVDGIKQVYYRLGGNLGTSTVPANISARGRTYEFNFLREPLLIPVEMPKSAITQESRNSKKARLNEAETHWILLMGKNGGSAPEASGKDDTGGGGDTEGIDTGGNDIELVNVPIKYLKFKTVNSYVFLPNAGLKIAGFDFEIADSIKNIPENAKGPTLKPGSFDKDDVLDAVREALFVESPAYRQMSGAFPGVTPSEDAESRIVNCWVEQPNISGTGAVTARERSRVRGYG